MKHAVDQITFIGAGSIATALGNILAGKGTHQVLLHSIDPEVVDDINTRGKNNKFFPALTLHPALKATTDHHTLEKAGVIFLAIPSVVLVDYLESIRSFIPEQTILVNLAKGFGKGQKTICQCLTEQFPNPVCTMKGPSFARDIISLLPTAFTLGYEDPPQMNKLAGIFEKSSIFLDFTNDITGVEILSILKNMYAVVMGIVDAQFNSANLRFLVLTKSFREMRKILLHYGGHKKTLFNYCGYGDFTLTALNDLSRNRTLGLLIGKGFFTEHISHELVLEGKTAVNIFYEDLSKSLSVEDQFPIIAELYKIFNQSYTISSFVDSLLSMQES